MKLNPIFVCLFGASLTLINAASPTDGEINVLRQVVHLFGLSFDPAQVILKTHPEYTPAFAEGVTKPLGDDELIKELYKKLPTKSAISEKDIKGPVTHFEPREDSGPYAGFNLVKVKVNKGKSLDQVLQDIDVTGVDMSSNFIIFIDGDLSLPPIKNGGSFTFQIAGEEFFSDCFVQNKGKIEIVAAVPQKWLKSEDFKNNRNTFLLEMQKIAEEAKERTKKEAQDATEKKKQDLNNKEKQLQERLKQQNLDEAARKRMEEEQAELNRQKALLEEQESEAKEAARKKKEDETKQREKAARTEKENVIKEKKEPAIKQNQNAGKTTTNKSSGGGTPTGGGGTTSASSVTGASKGGSSSPPGTSGSSSQKDSSSNPPPGSPQQKPTGSDEGKKKDKEEAKKPGSMALVQQPSIVVSTALLAIGMGLAYLL